MKKDLQPVGTLGKRDWKTPRREWNRLHPERMRAAEARYRAKHPERLKARNARYRALYPERIKAKDARYFEGKHEQNEICWRDECKCVGCGMIFKREDAILRGFQFMKYAGNKVICDECGGE